MAERGKASKGRNILAAAFGNALEWYDFGIYGFFAVIIGQKFFPSDDPVTSLLSAFATFALGYLVRPLGAVILGQMGDRFGRRPVLLLSIAMVGTATFSIGLLPTYDQVGVLAPLLLILLRFLQGFAVAGEYAGSTVYLIEQATAKRRGLDSSWSLFGQYVGILLGSGLAALIMALLTEAELHAWGWRVPFLLSLLFALGGLLLRWQVPESPAMRAAKAVRRASPLEVLRQEWRATVRFVAILAMSGVGFSLAYVYAVSDAIEQHRLTESKALDINTAALFAAMLFVPIAGALSDRVGRKALALASAGGTLVLAWPLWWLMHQESFLLVLLGQASFAILFSLGWAVYSVMVTENLPLRARCSVIAIATGIAYGILGGLTPLTAAYLVEYSGNDYAPVAVIMLLAATSLMASWRFPDRSGQALP